MFQTGHFDSKILHTSCYILSPRDTDANAFSFVHIFNGLHHCASQLKGNLVMVSSHIYILQLVVVDQTAII